MPPKPQTYFWAIMLINLTALIAFSASGQTYTSVSGCTNWDDESCWNVTNTTVDCNATTPPTNPSSPCAVDVIIQSPMIKNANTTFGGSFSSITIEAGGSLDINGDVAIASNGDIDFIFEDANQSIDISGELTINQDATLSVIGAPREEGEEISDFLNVGSLYLRGRSLLNIDDNSAIDVEGFTDAHTPSNAPQDFATINVDGGFFSTSVKIRGNSHLLFIVEVDAEVQASQTDGILEMNGNSSLTFKGDYHEGGLEDGMSYVDVGGAITTNGSEQKAEIVADDATIFTCNSFPEKITKIEDHEGKFEEGNCRILPVIWYDVYASYVATEIEILLSWSTLKEWETSHYEIERSIDGIDQFKTIGKVQARGWADTYSEYEFLDQNLPNQDVKIYYRIKQVDLDGSFAYSKTVMEKVDIHENDNNLSWKVFPNPTSGNKLSIMPLNGLPPKTLSIKLFLPEKSTQAILSVSDPSKNIQLDQLIAGAPKGLLILEVTWGKNTQRLKVINQ